MLRWSALLASDMDGTIIPLEEGRERRKEIQEFCDVVKRHPEVALAYVTGRHLELGLAGLERHGLPVPAVFVCDVGTSVYWRDGDGWRYDGGYHDRLRASWAGLDRGGIAEILRAVEGLIPQEREKQGEFKQSYYAPLSLPEASIVAAMRHKLGEMRVEANIIYSIDLQAKVGLVDVLPPGAAKDAALHFLSAAMELPRERVVYAGDSGNDLLAFVSGYQAIVVANTPDYVKEAVRQASCLKGIARRVYFAEHRYVKGVMEGCRHFGLFPGRKGNAPA